MEAFFSSCFGAATASSSSGAEAPHAASASAIEAAATCLPRSEIDLSIGSTSSPDGSSAASASATDAAATASPTAVDDVPGGGPFGGGFGFLGRVHCFSLVTLW